MTETDVIRDGWKAWDCLLTPTFIYIQCPTQYDAALKALRQDLADGAALIEAMRR